MNTGMNELLDELRGCLLDADKEALINNEVFCNRRWVFSIGFFQSLRKFTKTEDFRAAVCMERETVMGLPYRIDYDNDGCVYSLEAHNIRLIKTRVRLNIILEK